MVEISFTESDFIHDSIETVLSNKEFRPQSIAYATYLTRLVTRCISIWEADAQVGVALLPNKLAMWREGLCKPSREGNVKNFSLPLQKCVGSFNR
ncbi:hypothetical protein LINGRAHAP2_LOCUS15423 [Linum grandiflorum]